MSEQPSARSFSRRFLIAAFFTVMIIAAGAVAISAGGVDALGSNQLEDGQELEAEADLSVDEAIEIARGEADGNIDDVELERNGDRLVYEIEVGESDVYVDANDGTVLYVEHDDDDDGDDDGWDDFDRDDDDWDDDGTNDSPIDPASVTITTAEAIEIAQGEVEGSVDDVELDRYSGGLAYEIEIGNVSVYVDASDGSVLGVEQDD